MQLQMLMVEYCNSFEKRYPKIEIKINNITHSHKKRNILNLKDSFRNIGIKIKLYTLGLFKNTSTDQLKTSKDNIAVIKLSRELKDASKP